MKDPMLRSVLSLFILFNGLQAAGLKVAACQFPVSMNIRENATWIREQMREAAENGALVIQFPECALSGYAGVDFDTFDGFNWKLLEQELTAIMKLADDLDVWVIVGNSHRLTGDHKPHDSLYLIDPEGRIADRYDKRFCTNGDLKFYSPGDHFVQFTVDDVVCGLLICYDIRFPELYREYYKLGVQVIFQSFYNARQKEASIHPKIMPVTAQARAATNHFFMVLTNSSAKHSWPCHIITPDGLIAGKLPVDEPGILYFIIDTGKKYYDASAPFRDGAINGILNSGETVTDPRSQDRTTY
jgi:predicted amidohydrolase